MTVKREFALNCLVDLLKIPGSSGQEQAVSDHIVRLVKELIPGADIAIDDAHLKSPFGGQTGNLFVYIDGKGSAADQDRIVLSCHMDTVPLCVGVNPVIGDSEISTDRTTALGADNRSACAAILTALKQLLDNDCSHPPLTLLFTVQEEVGLVGASCLDKSYLKGANTVINIDGGEVDKLVLGGIGGLKWKASITGIASHAGVHPTDGVSAASVFAHALADLSRDGWHGAVSKNGNYGTSNIGTVNGGGASNVVMDQLDFAGECRSHELHFRDLIYNTFKAYFDNACTQIRNQADQRAKVEFERINSYPSFRVPEDDPLVERISSTMCSMGMNPHSIVCDGGMDANFISDRLALPVVTIGSGAHKIHTVDEILNLKEYYQCCDFLYSYLTEN